MPLIFWLLFLLCSPLLSAMENRFESGLIRSGSYERNDSALSEDEANGRFLKDEFGNFPTFEWRLEKRFRDSSHIHRTYHLYYRGYPVIDRYLKTHFNLGGWIQYASSNFASPFFLKSPKRLSWEAAQQKLMKHWFSSDEFRGKVHKETSVWIDRATGAAHWAYDSHAIQNRPLIIRHSIVDAITSEVLEDRRVQRQSDYNVTVYPNSPYQVSSPSTPLDPVAATVQSSDPTRLINDSVFVRRDQNPNAATYTDVVPIDFSVVSGFSKIGNADNYDYSCVGDGSHCPNQGFDAVNVFYHLSKYRARINGYFADLGVDTSLPYDPLTAIVNSMHVSFGTTAPNELTNNAVYVGEPCASDGEMQRCLLFFRPATVEDVGSDTGQTNSVSKLCGQSPAEFLDLSREALVAAHEYEHYVTDMVTGIVFGPKLYTFVGDALHEGYSDYLAASYVSETTGHDETLVGEYALQNCTGLQRQLNVQKVYDNSDAMKDPHTSGLVWASALWTLRTEYGVSVADHLAVKSLFFQATEPGFLDSIEAVVKADQALYGGSHEARIRKLFYQEAKFVGTLSGLFQDPTNAIANLGMGGCSSAHFSGGNSGLATLLLFITWLLITLFWGRSIRLKWQD